MTVTYRFFRFTEANGKLVAGSIFWDKYHPKGLKATLAHHLSPSEVDLPFWTSSAGNSSDGEITLVERLKRAASRRKLVLVEEGTTKYSKCLSPQAPLS
jgi:hypothetical protein